jgi:PPP family 3-phenylpropionic acid transporter
MIRGYRSSVIPSKRAAAFYATYFGVLGVVLPFLGPYLQSRGVAAVGIGLITALFSLAKLVYTPALGALVDRGLWFRGLLTVHLALSIVWAGVVNTLPAPWLLGTAFFFIGLGYGTVLPLVEAAILEGSLSRGYGVLRLWGSLGFIVVAAVAAGVFAGNRVGAFPAVLAAALAALAVSCWPFESAARPRRDPPTGRIPPEAWWLLLILTLHQVGHGPYYAFFSIYLKADGYSNATVSAMWSLGVIAELVAFLGGRRLESRLGLRRLLGLALLLTPVRWLLLAVPLSLSSVCAAQVGHAATFALVHLAGVQLVQRNVAAGVVRRAQALYSGLSFGLGIVVGSAIAGPLYGALGGSGSFLIAAAYSSILFVAWLPLAGRLSEIRR